MVESSLDYYLVLSSSPEKLQKSLRLPMTGSLRDVSKRVPKPG